MTSCGSNRLRGIVIVATLIGSTAGVVADETAPLPMRAVAVEGGLVAVQGGVRGDPSRPGLPFGKTRYPTQYFVTLKNETPSAVWAEVEMRLPEKKPKTDFGRIEAGKFGYWRWPAFGAIWNEPIPVRVSVYGDEGRTRRLGEREMSMYFDEADKDLLYHPPKMGKGLIAVGLLSGWREMNHDLCKIEGTAADEDLRWDICRTLWKLESLEHLDCEHHMAGVAPLDSSRSALLAAQPEDFKGRAEAFRTKGDLILETWSVKSCDAVTPYEVMLIKAPQGGTDIMAAPARPQPEAPAPAVTP